MAIGATSALRSMATAITVESAPGAEASKASARRQRATRVSQSMEAREIATTPNARTTRLEG
jgi:hypothetical protein